jgi:predicted ABC-type ATPase
MRSCSNCTAVTAGEPAGVETVLSSGKYRPLVEEARAAGGFVGLIYVALSSPAIARERVAARVRRGGHGVPDEKVDRRWKRSLDCLVWFAERASAFWVIDNSDSDPTRPPVLMASGKSGVLEFIADQVSPDLGTALAAMPR